MAHLYSYNQIGKTIAVLGCGFNHIFPSENTDLYKKILNNDGLIISEYPPETKCESKYFLKRNRIISGLSLGVLIVEATYRSGTSVTAKIATIQDRKVFALPHEIWDSHSYGTNILLKNGAILVTCTNDILDNFEVLKNKVQEIKIKEYKINQNCIIVKPKKSDNLKNSTSTSKSTMSSSLIKLKNYSPKVQSIYNLISDNPISINDIYKQCSESISSISNILFTLELEGLIKKVAGGYVCISNK